MKIKNVLTAMMLTLITLSGVAQEKDSVKNKSVFDRKMVYWGLSYTQGWTTFRGDRPFEPYFTKPSVGANVLVEFFPVNFVGIRFSPGYMQRGTGVILPDVDKSLGDPDSTYRTRIRFNTIEFPVTLVLRTPKDIIKGVRLAAGAGIVPYTNFETNRFYDSAEDGFHPIEDQTKMYLKTDMALQAFFGAHINVANYSQLHVELYSSKGTKNVYNDSSFGDANATQRTWGIRFSWVY